MNTDNWNGAQWLMVYYVFVMILLPLFLRAANDLQIIKYQTTVTFMEWLGQYVWRIIIAIILVTVLWWGGFWE